MRRVNNVNEKVGLRKNTGYSQIKFLEIMREVEKQTSIEEIDKRIEEIDECYDNRQAELYDKMCLKNRRDNGK